MYSRQFAIESFNQTLWKARRDNLLSKLMRKTIGLKRYQDNENGHAIQKRYLDVMEIPTDKITGSVGRLDDFDGRFRPLKNHLRDRWVNVALHSAGVGWPPIEVLKVGEDYFVIDGHHRTSFARSNGIAFIDAKVWEVQQPPVKHEKVTAPAKPVPVINPVPVPACGALVRESVVCCG